MERLAAIVLAAGSSRRMRGINKLLEPVAGIPCLLRAVQAALAGGLSPVVVVTGHQRERVRPLIAELPVLERHNPDHATGMAGSIATGLAALSATCGGVVVLLGDMPLIHAGVIDRLRASGSENPDALAVVPTCQGRRGNPVLLRAALFPRVRQLQGDTGARSLFSTLGDGLVTVEVADRAVVTDIDTPESLAAVQDTRS